jgi:hypothetical protein
MKTVFTTQEGVKMNSQLDFGDITPIIRQFHFFLETTETMWDLDIQHYYRITDDDFIQIAVSVDGTDPEIRAQYKLRYSSLKENVQFVIEELFEANLLYNGYPKFNKSELFSKQEFEIDIVGKMKREKQQIKDETLSKETPIISFLKEQGLAPKPSGTSIGSWMAKCPNGGKHFITVVAGSDEWGCGYCKKKGKLHQLEKWIQEIKNRNDQKRLTQMLKEIKKGSIQTKETLKWWINRY